MRRVPRTLYQLQATPPKPAVEHPGAAPEACGRVAAHQLQHRDVHGGQGLHPDRWRMQRGIELAHDRRCRGGAQGPDRISAERREVLGRHPDNAGHESLEQGVVVTGVKIAPELLEQTLAARLVAGLAARLARFVARPSGALS